MKKKMKKKKIVSYRTKELIWMIFMLLNILVRAVGNGNVIADILALVSVVLIVFFYSLKFEKPDEYTTECKSRADGATVGAAMVLMFLCGFISDKTGAKIFSVDMYFILIFGIGALNSLLYLLIDRPVKEDEEND